MVSKKLGFSLVGLVIVGVLLLATYSISVVGAEQQVLSKEQIKEVLEFFERQLEVGRAEGWFPELLERIEKSIEVMEEVVAGKRPPDLLAHLTPRRPGRPWPCTSGECGYALTLFNVDMGVDHHLDWMYTGDKVSFFTTFDTMEECQQCLDNVVQLEIRPNTLSGPGWYLFRPKFYGASVEVKAVFYVAYSQVGPTWYNWPTIPQNHPPGDFVSPLLIYIQQEWLDDLLFTRHFIQPTGYDVVFFDYDVWSVGP